MLSVQTLPRASGSHLAGTHRYRADANKRKQDVKHVTKLGTTCVFRPEKTHQVSLFLTYFKKIPYHQTTYKPTQSGDNSIYFSEELEQPFPFFCPLLTPPPSHNTLPRGLTSYSSLGERYFPKIVFSSWRSKVDRPHIQATYFCSPLRLAQAELHLNY